MRRTLIAYLMLVSSQALASPPTWADWVGDYRGTLTSRQCEEARSSRVATLALDAIDGVMAIDLAAARAGLRTVSLTQEDAAWVAQDGDLRVRVTKQANTIDLAIDYDSGCTVRGRLARATTGVPACDRMLAWARIEARCTKASTAEPDAKRTWKKADTARCTARADKLALAMIDAGCAPHSDPNVGRRAIECRALADVTQKLARCGRVPRELAQRLTNQASALSSASQTAEPATLRYVEQQCKDAHAERSATALQFRCPL